MKMTKSNSIFFDKLLLSDLSDENLRPFNLQSIQSLNKQTLVEVQARIGHGNHYGVWETSPTVLGSGHNATLLAISLRDQVIKQLPDEITVTVLLSSLLDEAELWMSRYALLLRLGPSSLRESKRSLDTSTIVRILYQWLPPYISLGVQARLDRPDEKTMTFMSCIDPLLLENIATRHESSRSELNRMRMLRERGLWGDAPSDFKLSAFTNPRGPQVDRSPQKITEPHQPLPDSYISAMGPRVLWFMRTLGPELLAIAKHLVEMLESGHWDSDSFSALTSVYMRKFTWGRNSGEPICPPFEFVYDRGRGSLRPLNLVSNKPSWEPTSWMELRILFSTLQTVHLWVTLLAMAGRIHEVLTLSRNCIVEAVDGQYYLKGKTYKLSSKLDGRQREWPAPDILIEALAQQRELVDAISIIQSFRSGPSNELESAAFLWSRFGRVKEAGNILPGHNHALSNLGFHLGLGGKCDEIKVYAHRFRKTIARLVALTVFESTRVLKQLLGHEDIQVTLNYLLSDKALQDEIEKIARELRVMRCKVLVEDIHLAIISKNESEHAGYGGGAIPQLIESVKMYHEELKGYEEKWGDYSAYELATTLTLNGQYYRVIRPGVICTKSAKELAPCNCDSDCIHRIEEKTARRDVRELLPVLIEQGKRAFENNQLLVLSNVMAQLEEELKRFKDIGAEWSEHETIIQLRNSMESL